ncbi:MAG: iron-containing alcohol dehydrogenase, partial [Clostridia bacterium]|nr:iron-containing alcohol dehydrogenase [Clostridia bacterium]
MINSFDFILPTKIRYGRGTIVLLQEELDSLKAKKIMIITDKGLVKTGLLKKVMDNIKIEYIIFDEIEQNPKSNNVELAAKVAAENHVDCLVAFGGGSPIDAAKAVSVLVKQGGKAKDYQGKGKIKEDCLPLLSIPTTAGTGSEVTFSSVITDSEDKVKFTIKSPAIAPKTAIVDPELTLTVPPLITAATGMDALTHAIEGYTVNCTEPIAEAMGLYAIELIVKNVLKAVKDGADIEARDQMMMGSLIAGLCFSHADVGSVHCMAEALGSMYDAPHGMCNSILLPYVMDYNLPNTQEKYARVARIMGIEEKEDDLAGKKGIEALKKLSKDLGLPGIKSLNVDPK